MGAGLSGLAAAIQSALGGHSVLVLESAKELGEVSCKIRISIVCHFRNVIAIFAKYRAVGLTRTCQQVGAGLQVTPNASKLLQRWGLSESLWASVAKPNSLNIRRHSDGKVLYCEKDFGTEMQRKYGAPFANIHRVDLQKALYERAWELGVEFRFGQRISEADISNGRVTSMSGESFEGNLVVGADGLWSKCAEVLLSRQDKPAATGDIVYRIILNADDIPDQDLKDRVTNPEINFWFGPGSHVVSYSVRAGTMLNIVLMCPDDLPPEISRKEGSCEELRQLFSTWDPTRVLLFRM